ncbi:GNAT family N-acetyltransferase [Roseococcus sp. SYP-B2431]|uniref:GNAT family N-acetyltransferase n=1 Tax=Roseococcus sp. SYP-B2431 TaxID=2496640 RepID=UPI0010390F12|nr:GNAT family N-acetyltransferase [Roseococcus sp. SYP-B2431]TCH97519.1 GNAT family N-acetyltransferase [Roseococcus sp. SYP-B2431]
MIRPARPLDAVPFAALLRALNDEPGLRPDLITPETVLRDLIEDPRAIVRLAEAAGALQGLAVAHPYYDSAESRWGFILSDLYVAPTARRRGQGRALVAALAAEASGQGGRFLWWDADHGDELALAFHRALPAEEGATLNFLIAGSDFERLAREAA